MKITCKTLCLSMTAGGVVLVFLFFWFLLSGGSARFALSSLVAHNWELPVLEYQFHGRPASWRLTSADGSGLVVKSDTVQSSNTYFQASCGVSKGAKQHWQWVAHSHHHTAVITLGQCVLTLKKIASQPAH